jgi:hypothetical protein
MDFISISASPRRSSWLLRAFRVISRSRLIPIRYRCLPWWALSLLLLAASCPSRDEETFPMIEVAYRKLMRGHLQDGVAGYTKAAERFKALEVAERPAWIRAFMLYTLHQSGAWQRIETRIRKADVNMEPLTGFVAFKGSAERVPEAARCALLDGRFHEEPGRWSRLPAWATTDMLRLCGDALIARARSPQPAMDLPGGEPPVEATDTIARLALARAAGQFYLRAWEIASTRGTPERDCRLGFVSVARSIALLQRELAAMADPEGQARRMERAQQWESKAYTAEENAPLKSLGVAADAEFVAATVQDHFEEGLKAFGAAVEERSGGGSRERVEVKYEEALEHLLTAREFRAVLTKEDATRLEFAARAMKGIRRILSGI